MGSEKELYGLLLHVKHGKRDELFEYAKGLIHKGGAIYTPNPIMLYDALKNEQLYSALMRGICIPDGVGVKIGLSYIGLNTDVLPGVELAAMLLRDTPVRFAVIGGSPGRAEAAALALERECQGSRCILALDGYSFSKRQLETALDIAKADVVLVCLGSPRQELFIDSVRDKFKSSLFLGLGGSVDVYSGAKRRAPRSIRALRLEWLYRMLREPRRFSGVFRIAGFLHTAKRMRRYVKREEKYERFINKKSKNKL